MAGEVLAGTTVKTWQNPSLKIDKKRKRVTVKTLSEFCNEMTLKYGDVPESLDVFYVSGTVSIPQNNAITISGQNVTYLYAGCQPKLFLAEEYMGDYRAVAEYEINRQYRGGDVIKVVEIAIKDSIKSMFTGKNSAQKIPFAKNGGDFLFHTNMN